jgi:hypothetical protein
MGTASTFGWILVYMCTRLQHLGSELLKADGIQMLFMMGRGSKACAGKYLGSGGMDSYTWDVGARRAQKNISTTWDSVDCDVGHNMPQAYATWDQGESSQRFNTIQVCAYI